MDVGDMTSYYESSCANNDKGALNPRGYGCGYRCVGVDMGVGMGVGVGGFGCGRRVSVDV
eukprot:7534593-Pyramimonas_sp.AAC.2